MRRLVEEEGSGQWEQKAAALGTGRTAIACMNKYSVLQRGRSNRAATGQQHGAAKAKGHSDAREAASRQVVQYCRCSPVVTGLP